MRAHDTCIYWEDDQLILVIQAHLNTIKGLDYWPLTALYALA